MEGRQRDEMIKNRRQVVGDLHRVQVPSTRIDRVTSTPRDRSLSRIARTSPGPSLKPEPAGRRETHGFDTDAESIGESITMSIAPTRNVSLQVVQPQIISKDIALTATAGSQHTRGHDQSRGQHEEPGLHDDELSAPSSEDDGSSDSRSADHTRSNSFMCDMATQSHGEDFLGFKRRNPLHELLQPSNSFREHAADPRLTFQSYKPVNAVEKTLPVSPRYLPPAYENAITSSNTMHQHAMHGTSTSAGFPGHRADFNNEDAPPSHTVQRRQNQSRIIDRQHERTSQPLSLYGPVQLDQSHKSINFTSASEILPSGKVSLDRPDDTIANRGFPGSESSDEHRSEVRTENENTQGVLKRKLSLDHSADQLRNMKFEDLVKDPFDSMSTPSDTVQSSGLADHPLRVTLEKLSSDETFHDGHSQHQDYCEKLFIGQYVECGEMIAEKLNQIISTLTQIRQEKRRVASKFQEEIEQREATVRGRVVALKRKKGLMARQTEALTSEETAQMDSKK